MVPQHRVRWVDRDRACLLPPPVFALALSNAKSLSSYSLTTTLLLHLVHRALQHIDIVLIRR
jgi:hypothetical protein